jgi:hypothetical protein
VEPTTGFVAPDNYGIAAAGHYALPLVAVHLRLVGVPYAVKQKQKQLSVIGSALVIWRTCRWVLAPLPCTSKGQRTGRAVKRSPDSLTEPRFPAPAAAALSCHWELEQARPAPAALSFDLRPKN